MNLKVLWTLSASALLLGPWLALNGCQSHRADSLPAIEFTRIPPAAHGDSEKTYTIAGRVNGARTSQQIVIYAHDGAWWVQPTVARPFTSLRTDSTWSTETHPGYEYAAVLVDPGYSPQPKIDVLPSEGGAVVRRAIVKGTAPVTVPPEKPLKISDYERDARRGDSRPAIEFTRIPSAAQGGRERVDTIAGRVTGARPGQQIVIYAHAGAWWVQPTVASPFTSIRADSTWSTETHLGYEYAALLVDPGYPPPPTMDTAPSQGGPVAVAAIVKGTGLIILAPTKSLKFSGYDWDVRTIASDRGGSSHPYSGDNAWTDSTGALHLRISKTADDWSCAEVVLNRSLGYGTYILVIRDISHLEPAAVLSMTTFDEWGGEQYYREMDVEVSHWGDASSKYNAQYVVEPYYHPGNVYQFAAPSGTLTYSMRWESGRTRFRTVRGNLPGPGAPVISEHEFTSGIPSPGQERLQLFFYVVASDKNPLQHDNEIVLEKFTYFP